MNDTTQPTDIDLLAKFVASLGPKTRVNLVSVDLVIENDGPMVEARQSIYRGHLHLSTNTLLAILNAQKETV